jgi:Recombination directionality factor-like
LAIIDLQRRLTEVGRIRTGIKVPGNNGRTRPEKLTTLRFTSPAQHLIEEIANLYGGTCRPWRSPTGPEFEVITERAEVPVYLPKQTIDPWYELWGNAYCNRRCDGETEKIRQAPCLCATEIAKGAPRACKPTTRLSVMLADVPGYAVWRLESHGWYAATELSALTELMDQLPDGMRLPARLLLQPREANKLTIVNGQEKVEPRKYLVPILLFDQVTSRQLAEGGDAIVQALVGGEQRQAIEAAPAAEPQQKKKHTPEQYIAMAKLARHPEQVKQLGEDATADGAATEEVKAVLNARWHELKQSAAEPEPVRELPAEQVVDAEIVPDPDPDMVWMAIVGEAGKRGWDLPAVEAKYREVMRHDPSDEQATGWKLAEFLNALKNGEVS